MFAFHMTSVGERWRAAREAAGFGVQEAATAADVHRNSIYDLEKGDEKSTLRLMNRVAATYGVTLGYIFREENAPERLPAEYRPLDERLRPLDMQARESIIRNIAANLGFMASLFAESSVRNRTEKETQNVSGSYATQQDNSGSSDEVEDFDRAAAIARKTERANAPSRSGRHAAEKTRGQGKR
jgi:DNA-binding XRE family transcriptional regulator